MKLYFVDTNYFLRLLIRENEKQYKTVYELFQKALKGELKIFTSVVVFFEMYWVLSSFYKKNKNVCLPYLEKVLKMEFLEIENRYILTKALTLFKNRNLDFEDCFNISFYKENKFDEFATFDKKIIRYTTRK